MKVESDLGTWEIDHYNSALTFKFKIQPVVIGPFPFQRSLIVISFDIQTLLSLSISHSLKHKLEDLTANERTG